MHSHTPQPADHGPQIPAAAETDARALQLHGPAWTDLFYASAKTHIHHTSTTIDPVWQHCKKSPPLGWNIQTDTEILAYTFRDTAATSS
ncbi:hypothetical protein IAQ61_003075 [Plenodomus lingam]|uniref:uncharacterized protein n=1 Tax=Leptosphaeria maculans TaxID=5022 RepID=UPI003320DCFE|nr:hypothetical protein IAQ61_003075 [Plenodomus lingam]